MVLFLRSFRPRSVRPALAIGALGALLAGCSTVPPDANAGGGANRTPGEPFLDNVCFQCTWRACNIPLRACAQELGCSRWFDCVAVCPTDASGVAAEPGCVQKCGAPVSASVLYECIQEHATGALRGCEAACTPIEANDEDRRG
jgi:hypothetical protein